MNTLRRLLFLPLLLLPVVPLWATSNYEYGPDEYVTIAHGISPDGTIAITAHGTGELGTDEFHLYLTDAANGKKIGALQEIENYLDTAAYRYAAKWSPDGQEVTIVWLMDRHEPLQAITYRINGRRAEKAKGPFNVKQGDALDKFFTKECVDKEGQASPKVFGTSLKPKR